MNSYLLWNREQRLLQRSVNRFLFFTVRTIIFMENTRMFKVRDQKVIFQYNPHISNIVDISGALRTLNLSKPELNSHCEEGARDLYIVVDN